MQGRSFLNRLIESRRTPILVRMGFARPEYEASIEFTHRLLKLLLTLNLLLFGTILTGSSLVLSDATIRWVFEYLPVSDAVRHSVHQSLPFPEGLTPVASAAPYALLFLALLVLLALGVASTSRALDAIVLFPELPTKPFVLFLRSFFIEKIIKAEPPSLPLLKFDCSLPREIQRAIGGDELVCKIGSRKLLLDLDGGIVWSHDDVWFERFKLLAKHSKYIVMVPIVQTSPSGSSEKPGTLQEIEHLAQEALLGKTVFVVPPSSRVLLALGRGQGLLPSVPALWEASRRILKHECLVELPPYPGGHGLLFPDANGWIFVRAVSGRPWNSWRALRNVLVDKRLSATAARDAARIATRFVLVLLPIYVGLLYLTFKYGLPYLVETIRAQELAPIVFSSIGTSALITALLLVPMGLPLMSHLRYVDYFYLRRRGVWLLKFGIPVVAVLGHACWKFSSEPITHAILSLDQSWRGLFADLMFVIYLMSMWALVWFFGRWVFSTFPAKPHPWR